MDSLKIILIVGLVVATFPAFSDSTYTVRVNLNVGESANSDQIESFVRRELRAYSDVVVQSDGARWDVSILLIDNVIGDRQVGVTAAVLVLANIDADAIATVMEIEGSEREFLKDMLEGGAYLRGMTMLTHGGKNYGELAERIVAWLDVHHFEPTRQLFERIQRTTPPQN